MSFLSLIAVVTVYCFVFYCVQDQFYNALLSQDKRQHYKKNPVGVYQVNNDKPSIGCAKNHLMRWECVCVRAEQPEVTSVIVTSRNLPLSEDSENQGEEKKDSIKQ